VAQTIIDEVTVIELKRAWRALQPAVEIDRATINETAPATLTDIFRHLPSVGIRTNSRGEAVLRLRGSEERQTGIFLDGAPLSVPWDGRVDLSALPAGIVDQVRVTASAAPFEFGANSTLGVVEIRTPLKVQPGLVNAQAELGSQDSALLSAVGGFEAGPVDWLFGGTLRTLGGEAVSSTSVIPYGPTRDGARVNTDLESSSLFVAASALPDWGAVRASLFSVGAERGIANAGHIDPASGSPRYWRYPHWRFNQLTINAAADLGNSTNLRSTVWLQHFEQTIDQYSDDSYSIVESSEHDEDKTLGMRMVLDRPFDAFDVRVVGNAQVTTHEQVDTDHLSNVRGPLQRFQEDLFSLGAEIDLAPGDATLLSAGLSYNLAATPQAGGRESQADLSSWAANIAARWFPAEQWEVAATVGRRTRFPTLRELYGEALGQFVLNPDLRPETALLADLTFQREWRVKQMRLRLAPWLTRIDDTLSTRTIVVDGVRLRQRYNLKGSLGHGFEAGIEWRIRDDLELRLNGNWQDHEARPETDGTRPVLYLRPETQLSLAIDYVFAQDWDLFLEVQHVGTALDEDEDGTVVRLPTSTEVNLRLFRTLRHDDDGRWRAYAGIDNLSNDIVLPQLGLPLPGRTLSIGVRFERL
jgi:iron complex outermembrane receptor protein